MKMDIFSALKADTEFSTELTTNKNKQNFFKKGDNDFYYPPKKNLPNKKKITTFAPLFIV